MRGIGEFTYGTDHSKSDWVMADVMIRYLAFLRSYMNTNLSASWKTIHLLLDVYAAHQTDNVKKATKEHNIELHYIPAGCTADLQPLDIKVFSALKAKARGYWYTHYSLNPKATCTKLSAVRTLLTCWAELSEDVIRGSWEQYQTLLREESEYDAMIESHDFTEIRVMRTI